MAALFTPRELADSQASDPAAKKLIPIIFTSHLEKSSCYEVSEKWAHHSVSKPDSELSINESCICRGRCCGNYRIKRMQCVLGGK